MQTEARTSSGKGPSLELPPEAAFVLQLARPGEGSEPGLRGRVEHITSGVWTYFEGTDELRAFLRGALCQPSPSVR